MIAVEMLQINHAELLDSNGSGSLAYRARKVLLQYYYYGGVMRTVPVSMENGRQ